MSHTLLIILIGVWGGIWWRFRGGALTALTGFDPGTNGMRAIAAVALSVPFLFASWHFAALIPALWLAWVLAGWGAFQRMDNTPINMANPIASKLVSVGVTNPVHNDLAGMAAEGLMVMMWPSSTLGLLHLIPLGAMVPVYLSGLAFSPLYYLADRVRYLPDAGRFARIGSEWAEVMVGFWVAAVLAIVIY